MVLRVVIFLIINFAGLGIGSMFTTNGVTSEWYQNLNKAPWTPPGWVFGVAWTTIMICFSVYMAYAWQDVPKRNILLGLFSIQLVLNIIWNPIFFKFHAMLFGLIVIVSLTFLIGYFLFNYYPEMKIKSLLILPYFVWLVIATTLNGYAYFMN